MHLKFLRQFVFQQAFCLHLHDIHYYLKYKFYFNEDISNLIDDRIIVFNGTILKEDIGLVEVHLYRPFSTKYFLQSIPKTVETVAVLDRTKEPGSGI